MLRSRFLAFAPVALTAGLVLVHAATAAESGGRVEHVAFRRLGLASGHPDMADGARLIAEHAQTGTLVYECRAGGSAAVEQAVSAARASGYRRLSCRRSKRGGWVVPTGRLIVQFRGHAQRPFIRRFLSEHGGRRVRPLRGHRNRFVVHVDASVDPMETATTWRRCESIDWVYADCLRQAAAHVQPNDPRFSDQWALHNTGQSGGMVNRDVYAAAAWNIGTGAASVVIAVIDDGFDLAHPDLAANVFSNALEGVPGQDGDGNGYTNDFQGWDFPGNDNDPAPAYPEDNHGTAVLGPMIAVTDNGIGLAGVAHGCRFLPLRAMSQGAYSDLDVVEAILYAADKADVISISWDLTPIDIVYEALRDAVASGRAGLGCLVFTALGNDGVPRRFSTDAVTAPEVVTVSGASNYDRKAWFSDYGVALDLVAPASGGSRALITTDRTGAVGYVVGDYNEAWQGTSASAPIAAGVAALILAHHPTWAGLEIRRHLAQTCDRPDAVAHPYNARGWNERYGYGRINAWAALTTEPEPLDPYEPDNESANAASIEDGELQYRALSPGTNDDWAVFSLEAQSDVRLTLVGTTHARVRLRDGTLTPLASNMWRVVASNLAAGTYYAEVDSPSTSAIPCYGLHLALLNMTDAHEPDNARATATPIRCRVPQAHTFYPAADGDWAAFSISNAAQVEIVTQGELGGDTMLWLRDSAGLPIASNDDFFADSAYSYITWWLNPGDYYIEVREFGDAPLTSYQLFLEVHGPDPREPNDASGQATPIESGARESLTLAPAGDEDWFTFTLARPANVLLMTDTPDPSWVGVGLGNTRLTLYDADVQQLAQNDDGNSELFSAIYQTNLAAGVYYAMVERVGGGIDPNYTFAFDAFDARTELTRLTQSAAGPSIGWPGDASYEYVVQYVDDLFTGSWSNAAIVEGRVGPNVWTDDGSATVPGPAAVDGRFYRLLTQPIGLDLTP